MPAGALALDVLRNHLLNVVRRGAHRREIRFSHKITGPCVVVREGITGSKFYCGYFAVTARMLALGVEARPCAS